MLMLSCHSRSRLIAAFLAIVVGLSAIHTAAADQGSFEHAWKEGDFETVLKELQPLVDAGNEEAIKAAEFAKGMIELQKHAAAHRNAEGPIDLGDYDERYRPNRSEVEQRQFDSAQAAHADKDYGTAFKTWLPLAEAGDAESQHAIATLYLKGLGTNRDEAKADEFHVRAADQGYGPAQAAIAINTQVSNMSSHMLSRLNDSDIIDQRLSFYWAFRSALNGNRLGYNTLSFAYCHGFGTNRNPVLADVWLYMEKSSKERLAEHGCSSSLKYPASYRNAIIERAEAMSKAYGIPIYPAEE